MSIVHNHRNAYKTFADEIVLPLIPKCFLDDPSIAQILASTINEFEFEEKVAIYLFCTTNLSINEIATITELFEFSTKKALLRFVESLSVKLSIFEDDEKSSSSDKAFVRELFALENVKNMLEREYHKQHTKWNLETCDKNLLCTLDFY